MMFQTDFYSQVHEYLDSDTIFIVLALYATTMDDMNQPRCDC